MCVCVCHPPIYVSGTNWKRQLRYVNFAISWVGYIPQVGRVFHPTTQRQSLNFNQKVALESPKRTQHVSALPLNPKTRMAFKGLNIAGSVTRHDSCQIKANVETGGPSISKLSIALPGALPLRHSSTVLSALMDVFFRFGLGGGFVFVFKKPYIAIGCISEQLLQVMFNHHRESLIGSVFSVSPPTGETVVSRTIFLKHSRPPVSKQSKPLSHQISKINNS